MLCFGPLLFYHLFLSFYFNKTLKRQKSITVGWTQVGKLQTNFLTKCLHILFLTADSKQFGMLVWVIHCSELKLLQTTRLENHPQAKVSQVRPRASGEWVSLASASLAGWLFCSKNQICLVEKLQEMLSFRHHSLRADTLASDSVHVTHRQSAERWEIVHLPFFMISRKLIRKNDRK